MFLSVAPWTPHRDGTAGLPVARRDQPLRLQVVLFKFNNFKPTSQLAVNFEHKHFHLHWQQLELSSWVRRRHGASAFRRLRLDVRAPH